MSSCGIVTVPGALPTLIRSACGGRQVEQRLDRQPVVHDDVGPAQHLVGAHREQPWIPGPGADEVDGHCGSKQRVGGDLAVAEVLEQLLDHVEHERRVVARSDLEELEPIGVRRVDAGVDGGQVGLDLGEAGGDPLVQLGDRRVAVNSASRSRCDGRPTPTWPSQNSATPQQWTTRLATELTCGAIGRSLTRSSPSRSATASIWSKASRA